MPDAIAAVVVDHDAGPLLDGCVRSLLDDGAAPVVVVENGAAGSAAAALADVSRGTGRPRRVRIVRPGRNVGYGAGVNRGLAALAGEPPPPEWILVCNPDLVVHPGALAALRQALESEHAWALVGPRIFDRDGRGLPLGAQLPLASPTRPGTRCWRCSTRTTPSPSATTPARPKATW